MLGCSLEVGERLLLGGVGLECVDGVRGNRDIKVEEQRPEPPCVGLRAGLPLPGSPLVVLHGRVPYPRFPVSGKGKEYVGVLEAQIVCFMDGFLHGRENVVPHWVGLGPWEGYGFGDDQMADARCNEFKKLNGVHPYPLLSNGHYRLVWGRYQVW